MTVIKKEHVALVNMFYLSIYERLWDAVLAADKLKKALKKLKKQRCDFSKSAIGKDFNQEVCSPLYFQLIKNWQSDIAIIKAQINSIQADGILVFKSLLEDENLLYKYEYDNNFSSNPEKKGHIVNIYIPELDNANDQTKERYCLIGHLRNVILMPLRDMEQLCNQAIDIDPERVYSLNDFSSLQTIQKALREELSIMVDLINQIIFRLKN